MSWLVLSAICCGLGCSGVLTTSPPTPPTNDELTLPFRPTYLVVLQREAGLWVYLEESRDGLANAYGVLLDDNGRRQSDVVQLVEAFEGPFGEVLANEMGLLVGLIHRSADGESLWDLWSWTPPQPSQRLLRCVLPTLGPGLVLATESSLAVIWENTRGGLEGYTTSIYDPRCPRSQDVTALAGPLVGNSYSLQWLDGRIILAQLVGDSFSLRFFGPDFRPQGQARLAVGRAGQGADLSLTFLEDLGAAAVFSADWAGSRDLYLAPLDQLSAAPLSGRRVVATAERERQPRLVQARDQLFISWTSVDSVSGQTILLGGPLRLDGTVLRGGEVLWRPPGDPSTLWTAQWTDRGLVRIWIETIDGQPTLQTSIYHPSFWRVD